MKKAKQIHKPQPKLSPEQTIEFLDDYAKLLHNIDKKTKLISLRVPENILSLFKTRAKLSNQKYQTLIVSLMRKWIEDES